jgi:hypothetical protein
MFQAERWFQKLSKNWMGKRFMEKADCKKFFKHMEEQHPAFAAENANKLNIMSVCASQKQASARACHVSPAASRPEHVCSAVRANVWEETRHSAHPRQPARMSRPPRCTSTLLA